MKLEDRNKFEKFIEKKFITSVLTSYRAQRPGFENLGLRPKSRLMDTRKGRKTRNAKKVISLHLRNCESHYIFFDLSREFQKLFTRFPTFA